MCAVLIIPTAIQKPGSCLSVFVASLLIKQFPYLAGLAYHTLAFNNLLIMNWHFARIFIGVLFKIVCGGGEKGRGEAQQ